MGYTTRLLQKVPAWYLDVAAHHLAKHTIASGTFGPTTLPYMSPTFMEMIHFLCSTSLMH